MTDFHLDPQDERLLAEWKRALAEERSQRPESERAAFARRLRERLAEQPAAPVQRPLWRRPRLLLAAAALMAAAAMASMMVWLGDERAEEARALRRAAARAPVSLDPAVVTAPELFAGLDGVALVFLPYDYHGERCLWIYREEDIRFRNRREEEDFNRMPKWRAAVEAGRLTIPPDALTETFGEPRDLVLLRVGRHFEIWERAALARFLNQSDPPA